MIQIALETSTRHASVCLANSSQSLGEFTVSPPDVATQALLPGLQKLLTENEIATQDVDQISVSIGPGSFTGLRMGVAVAKTFAFAQKCKVFQCSTHSVVAYQAAEQILEQGLTATKIASVINAQRNQWFAATHEFERANDSATIRMTSLSQVVEPEAFVCSLPPEQMLLCGDGLARPPKNFQVPAGLLLATEEAWRPTAATLAKIAATQPDSGQFVEPLKLMPDYGRKSAAEEVLAAKNAH